MTIFKDINVLRQFVKVSPNMNISELEPYIEEAELSFIKELIGDQYDLLKTDYVDNDGDTAAMNADLKALLPYVQRPLAYHSMFLAIVQMGVQVGNVGIMQERHDKSEPAPKWKVDKLEAHYLKSGDAYAEKLLAFLEENASPTKYNTWYASDKNTIAEGLIVRTAKTAALFVDIEEAAYRIFMKMKKRIRSIESSTIKQLICKEQYDELVTQIKTDQVTADNNSLLLYLQPIITKMGLYQTLPSLRFHLSDKGITIYSSNDSTVSKSAATMQEVKALMCDLKEGEFGYESDIQTAKKYIEDNIDTYPLIKESTSYTSKPTTGPKRVPTNYQSNSHFRV